MGGAGRSWLWSLALAGCAGTASVVDDGGQSGTAVPPFCDEVSREVLALDEVGAGMPAAPADWLAAAAGEWRGEVPGDRVWVQVSAAGDTAELVTSVLVDPTATLRQDPEGACPPRYVIPVVQVLATGSLGPVARSEGAWETADGSVFLVTQTALVDVSGLQPIGLVPSEWDTVDLQLVSQPATSGGLLVDVTWEAMRETEAATSAVATAATSTTTVQVSGTTEPVWSIELRRDDD